MARFHGVVGYGESVESPADSGIWVDQITEVSYFGDVVRNSRKLETESNVGATKLNSDISVGNSISIVADQYAIEHFFLIKYVQWAGTLWTVTNVDVQSPRLLLRLGSVYNGPTP
jgi:hypothetical protein